LEITAELGAIEQTLSTLERLKIEFEDKFEFEDDKEADPILMGAYSFCK
jgi:hypothetical protein